MSFDIWFCCQTFLAMNIFCITFSQKSFLLLVQNELFTVSVFVADWHVLRVDNYDFPFLVYFFLKSCILPFLLGGNYCILIRCYFF